MHTHEPLSEPECSRRREEADFSDSQRARRLTSEATHAHNGLEAASPHNFFRWSAAVWLCLCLVIGVAAKKKEAKPKDIAKSATTGEELVYRGACDASAAAAIGTNWVVVATDEENRLRVYERDRGGLPLQEIDLTRHLNLDRHSPETDIEGAARLGDCIYWITSHSRNHEGKVRPNRYRFFATRFSVTNGKPEIEFMGTPYQYLLNDLIAAPQLQRFNFAGAASLHPKARSGLNIEGLCATPDNQLLIAFRNPVPDGQALLVPLKNPEQVVTGLPAQFGEAILLNLDGLGIRDIAYDRGLYVIIAGSFDGGGRSKLFSWTGGAAKPRLFEHVKLKNLNPEAVAIYADKGLREFQLFSDDSAHQLTGKPCRDLKGSARTFRSVWITHE